MRYLLTIGTYHTRCRNGADLDLYVRNLKRDFPGLSLDDVKIKLLRFPEERKNADD